jgi:transposase-like protein
MKRSYGPAYAEEFKREVLEYARDAGGAFAAEVKYHVPYGAIYSWNKALKVFDTLNYTEEDKIKILEFAAVNGIAEAHKEFGVAKTSLYAWARKHPGMLDAKVNRRVPDEKKIEILEYARAHNEDHHGIHLAAKHYGFDAREIRTWNKNEKLHRVDMLERGPSSSYCESEKLAILAQVASKGWEAAAKDSGVGTSTLYQWEKELGLDAFVRGYSKETMEAVIAELETKSLHDVAIETNIHITTIWAWYSSRGTGAKRHVQSLRLRDVPLDGNAGR